MDADTLVLIAAKASRVENQDAIDASIVGMLGDPKEVSDTIHISIHTTCNISAIACVADFAAYETIGKGRNH